MAGQAGSKQEKTGNDTMLREAMDALRQGDRARARDLLTRLLKTDQKNPTYWVWLSTAVDTQKERVYCLQTALQADPDNAAAKRGLRMFGALPPDDNVKPFPVNRPRQWDEKLTAQREPKVKQRSKSNPVLRFFMILGIAVLVLGGLYLGGSMLLPNGSGQPAYRSPTHHPTYTLILTPTFTPIIQSPTPTFLGATPLWMFLSSTYTPTPLYVMTVHPPISRNAFETGLRFLALGDYTNAMVNFQQAITLEPDAPDLYYYVGEIYRAEGDYKSARDAYQQAINADAEFAPAFLGRALANLGLAPKLDVTYDLNEAIYLDPNYTEAYIARGAYYLISNPTAAQTDLEKAVDLNPDSAPAYLYLAQADLALGHYPAALSSALRANQLDKTLVPTYLTLAQAYIASGQSEQAISLLLTYKIYAPNDYFAYQLLGAAYNATGQFDAAVEILNSALKSNWRNAETYYEVGFAYLSLGKVQQAEDDFRLAVKYDPSDFDSFMALAKAYDQEDEPGDAYLQVSQNAYPLAKTDQTKAQVYYWEGRYLQEIGNANALAGARTSWYQLIALPPDVVPETWRNEAYQYLNITPTYTPTLYLTSTPPAIDTRVPTISPTP
jgi:tetratricopeptide (TPR) repeat protein